MKRKKLLVATALVLLLVSPLIALREPPFENIDTLIQEALLNNPELQASRTEWKSKMAGIPYAGSLPDPVFGFNIMNLPAGSFSFDQEPMTGKQISLMQMIPFPGKLSLQKEIAVEAAGIKELEYQELKIFLIQQVKSIAYDIKYVDNALETSEKTKDLLFQLVHIVENRYRVGKGLHQDVLRAQVELSKISDTIIRLKQKRTSLTAELNHLLDRNPSSPIKTITAPENLTYEYDPEHLKGFKNYRPIVKSWQALLNQSDKMVSLSKKARWPDFKLGFAYTQRDVLTTGMGGRDFFSVMFSMNIPFLNRNKQRSRIEENILQNISLKSRYESLCQRIEKEIEVKMSELDKNKRLHLLYRDVIIPQAEQALQSAHSSYKVDKIDFLTLLTSQMILYQYELEYLKTLTDYLKNIAELDYLAGEECAKQQKRAGPFD